MNPTLLFPALAGLLFGAGLVISGMADPARVLGFLTLAPGWDPSLAFVMAGALAVTVPGFALLRRRGQPLFAAALDLPVTRQIDRRLLIGAAIFGLGWGLQGYCPGPAVVAFGMLQWPALLFLPAMFAGGWLSDRLASASFVGAPSGAIASTIAPEGAPTGSGLPGKRPRSSPRP